MQQQQFNPQFYPPPAGAVMQQGQVPVGLPLHSGMMMMGMHPGMIGQVPMVFGVPFYPAQAGYPTQQPQAFSQPALPSDSPSPPMFSPPPPVLSSPPPVLDDATYAKLLSEARATNTTSTSPSSFFPPPPATTSSSSAFASSPYAPSPSPSYSPSSSPLSSSSSPTSTSFSPSIPPSSSYSPSFSPPPLAHTASSIGFSSAGQAPSDPARQVYSSVSPLPDTVVLGGASFSRPTLSSSSSTGSSSSISKSSTLSSSSSSIGGGSHQASPAPVTQPVAPGAIGYQHIFETVNWLRSPRPGTPRQQAEAQKCWPRLDTLKRNLLEKAFENTAAVQEHLRMWTGNKQFLVTYNAKHAFCRPGPLVRRALLTQPGMTAARLDAEPDHRNVAQRHFAALGNGKWPSLQKPIWGNLLTGLTNLSGCGVLDNLTITAKEIGALKLWFSHLHITWDLPDSNVPSRFVHDGSTLIYVINAHCIDCHVTPFGDVLGVFKLLDRTRQPSNPPVEIAGDLKYQGTPRRPCGSLDVEPDDLEEVFRFLPPPPLPTTAPPAGFPPLGFQ